MAIVGWLLLITCVNLASLLLARGAAREREFAVRVGIGASRSRLMTQVLTESLLLSVSGALLGILFAYFGAVALIGMLASGRIGEQVHLRVRPDLHVLLFSGGIAIATGLFFGMAPALNAIRSMPLSTPAPDRRHWRNSLEAFLWQESRSAADSPLRALVEHRRVVHRSSLESGAYLPWLSTRPRTAGHC